MTFRVHWYLDPLSGEQSKWTLAGQLLERKEFDLSLPDRHLRYFDVKQFDTSGRHTHGHKTLRRLRLMDSKHDTIDLIYDHVIDKMSVRWNHCVQLSTKHDPYDKFCGAFLTSDIVYHWNSLHRRLGIFDADNGTITLHPYQLDIRESSARSLLDSPSPKDCDELKKLKNTCLYPSVTVRSLAWLARRHPVMDL